MGGGGGGRLQKAGRGPCGLVQRAAGRCRTSENWLHRAGWRDLYRRSHAWLAAALLGANPVCLLAVSRRLARSVVDPVALQTTHCIELGDNEAALR